MDTDTLTQSCPDRLTSRLLSHKERNLMLAYLRLIAYWSLPRRLRREIPEPPWPEEV